MNKLSANLFTCKPGRVHIMGICGVGAAGMAWLLYLRGWHVTGCDKAIPPQMGAFFRLHSIKVYTGQDVSHITDCDTVVYSAAISKDEPELVLARKSGLTVLSRGECLAGWISGLRSVAVCGTHGKTTTSCFTTRLFQLIGASPLWCLGGYTTALGFNAGPIANVKPRADITVEEAEQTLAIAEADESDGTLALDSPAVTVITNIDMDHLDHFHTEEEIEACFMEVVKQTRKAIAVCADHPRAMRVASCYQGSVLTFGFSENAIVRAANLVRKAEGTTFDLWYGKNYMGEVFIGVPGDHNVCNALGSFSAGILMGFDARQLCDHLSAACEELPKRRFQWVLPKTSPVSVVIDYAHHPVEIKAAMATALMQAPRRLRVVFQPHRYSRTRALLKDFPEAFDGAQEVILFPTYSASEAFIQGGESHDLYAQMRERNLLRPTLLARSEDEVLEYLQRTARTGDMILIVGAGDVVHLAARLKEGPALPLEKNNVHDLLSRYSSNNTQLVANESLSRHTCFKTGGEVDCYATITSIPDLCAISILCYTHGIPFQIIGCGANTWFSDFGLKGVLCSLSGEAFKGFERNGLEVTVGAAMIGAACLKRLEEEGLSGLEFMQGIPGNIGGWTYVNAGAHQHAIWERIRAVRGVTEDGQVRRLKASDITAGYRSVHGLHGLTLTDVTFVLTEDTPEAIRLRRKEAGENRIQLAGLRTCGSLFRNPDNHTAVGKLLDQLGAKAWQIGGASIAPQHANVIVSGDNCTASDLLALMYRLRSAYQQHYAGTLSPEVRGIEAYADGASETQITQICHD